MDEVGETGRGTVTTKRGRATARLVPLRASLGTWFGRDGTTSEVRGDIDAPINLRFGRMSVRIACVSSVAGGLFQSRPRQSDC